METAQIKTFLENQGFSVSVERRKPYLGSIEPDKDIITAMRAGRAMIPIKGVKGQLTRLQEALRAVPLAVQIVEVLAVDEHHELALFQKIDATLIWELEEVDRPPLTSVKFAIDSFIRSLCPINLVNADIRPWNIIYRKTDATFHFIDWGFGFFAGDQKSYDIIGHLNECGHHNRSEMEIDREDMKRSIEGLKNPPCIESQWGYEGSRFTWRPKPWL